MNLVDSKRLKKRISNVLYAYRNTYKSPHPSCSPRYKLHIEEEYTQEIQEQSSGILRVVDVMYCIYSVVDTQTQQPCSDEGGSRKVYDILTERLNEDYFNYTEEILEYLETRVK